MYAYCSKISLYLLVDESTLFENFKENYSYNFFITIDLYLFKKKMKFQMFL